MRLALLGLALFLAGCANVMTSSIPSHDFGTIYIGEGRASGGIVWTNNGKNGVAPQTVKGDWGAGSPFALAPSALFPGTLAPTQTTVPPVIVTFVPTAVGKFSGKVDLTATSGGAAVTADTVKVKGEAVTQLSIGDLNIGAGAIVANQVLDFGSVQANVGPAVSKRFDILNMSNAPITINGSFHTGGRGFTIVSPTPATNIVIPALRKVTIKIEFLPTAVGTFNDVVEFVSTDSKHIAGTAVTGKGIRGLG